MGSLSNLYISQSYQSLIHLGNDSSASTSLVELQDGVGNGLGVSINTLGLIQSAGLLVSGAVDINTNFSSSTQGYINQSSINNEIRITGSYTAFGNEADITEIGIGWVVNGGDLINGRVIGITGTPNVDVTYTIDQYYTANGVTYTFTGSIEREVEIEGDLNVSDDLFVGGHLIIEDGVEITGSIDITGDVTASNAWIQGDLVVSGTINAYEIITTIESASVIFSSGSNILGDETSDTQTLIGTIIMSGSSQLTGSMSITGDFTASGNISSSTISGIGNVTTYSQSVDSRLDFLEGPFSTSVDLRLDQLEAFSSSLQADFATQAELTQTASFLQNQINQKLNTSSFNAYTQSQENLNLTFATTASLNSLSSSVGSISTSIQITDSNQTTRINQLASLTGSYATSGSNTLTGNQIISGSLRGAIIPLSVVSQTASMDLSLGNFFTLTLPTSSITFLNPTNIQPGQSIQLIISQQSVTGSLRYPNTILFSTGSSYSASVFPNAKDIVSFLSDTTNLYGVSVKNFV
jgi:hypothetical protein